MQYIQLQLQNSNQLPTPPEGSVNFFVNSNSKSITINDSDGNVINGGLSGITVSNSGMTVEGTLKVTGNTSINGLTASTISATTYYNLPTFTGGTVIGNTTFSSGVTVNNNLKVTGNTSINGLTASTISATTINANSLTATTVSATTYLNVSKYKVFTALLTQNGSGTTYTANSQSSDFIIGQTYTISTYNSGDDFINVGAPSNQTNIKFIATATTATTWANGSILSYNSGSPVVDILENNLPFSLSFSRGDTGRYGTNTFSNSYKVAVVGTNSNSSVSTIMAFGVAGAGPNNYIEITTRDLSGTSVDSRLRNNFFEVRVYN